ncbi:MAG: RNA 2'-phosphotransferase [Verrucomicrobiales bacterium]|nr:RNA 2'-phosphotransferase [Verrucomicrobiales bacterium]
MTEKETIRASKFMSFVLRHSPESAGLKLDSAGWVEVTDLLYGISEAKGRFTFDDLNHVVETNKKKRFEFNEDRTKLRASQGHSLEVDLEYEAKTPPACLYHGTAIRFLDSIRTEGLKKMNRHHVHLSDEKVMTMKVGARHGKPTLLTIKAKEMHDAGHAFWLSTNNVWLTDKVPVNFIEFS